MTRKEIKEMKKRWREALATPTKPLHDPVPLGKLIDEYLEGLEDKEPCDDAIDRAEAMTEIMMFAGNVKPNEEDIYIKVSDAVQLLRELQSVTPKPKTGHWILADEQNKEDVENDNYRFICSECQCSDIHAKGTKVPYCWNCGAKMESEDK